MFRLLFVFYAAARNLLTNDEINSFRKILNKSVSLFHSNKSSKQSFALWEELREVFGIIDVHYNGGLFDPQENKFIEANRVSDYFLCRVLYNMNFYEDEHNNEKSISFRDMGVRHLGTLYEGLLEHKLFVAQENTQVKIEKGVVKFIPESEGGVIIEGEYVKKGAVYFAGDRGERKSTGSFYTPEYIVDYLVTNTVCEKLKELKEEFVKETAGLLEDINAAVDESERKALIEDFRDKLLSFVKNKILKLSVLDPAMGSGHFLVSGTNKISNFITEFLNDYDFIFKDTSSTTYWRRRVVENCIYGVDINPLAVELAKLSLWILSMAKDAHLSFLNHHLKCGNSLIGARLSDIGIYPGNKKASETEQISMWDKDVKFKEIVEKVIHNYLTIETRETNDEKDIDEKKNLLNEINEALNPYKKVCDYHTSIYFDNNVDETEYFAKIKKPETIKVKITKYFHWELEFPEVFRDFKGFVCLVGNPPWGSDIIENNEEKIYYRSKYITTEGKFDFYKLFMELGNELLHDQSIFGFITPNTWLTNQQATKLRSLLLRKFSILKIYDYGQNAFEGVSADTIVYCAKKENSHLKYVDVYSNLLGKWISTDQSIWLNNSNHTINIHSDSFTQEILELCNGHKVRLGDFADMCQGVVPYSKSSFIKKYGKVKGTEIVDKRLFHSKKKVSDEWLKEISGKDVFRYQIISDESEWIKYGNWLHRSRDLKYFQNPRIVVRRIFGKKRFIATFTDEKIIQSSLLHSILINSNKFSAFYVLGLLNSKLLGYYFTYATSKEDITFPEVRLFELEQLPISDNSEEVKNIIGILVKLLLSMKPETNKNNGTELVEKTIDYLVYVIYLFNSKDIIVPKVLLNILDFKNKEHQLKYLVEHNSKIAEWFKSIGSNKFVAEIEDNT